MNLETFLEKFDQFADAPNAVAKMRDLVLELAVRGKLSQHRASDEKDAAWLKLAEQLDADSGAYNSDIDPPFEIPSRWRWTTLARLGDTKPRNDAPDSAKSSFLPMTLIPAEYGQRARHEERPWGEIKKGYTHFQDGDVVMAKITPCFENGKSAVMRGLTGGFGAGTTELHVFRRSSNGVLPEFVIIYLKTRGFIARGIPKMTGSAGQKRVPSEYFGRSPFPLPPLAEQKRIVAKVDELMALCDRLETQQQERETRHTALARAALARFAGAPTPANLDWIFHSSFCIPPSDLRKSILTLAVQGKLVPQDANDEPAEALLERITLELSPENRRRQAAPLPSVDRKSAQFKLPDSWTWARFRDVAIIASNLVKPDEFKDFTHLAPDNIEKGNGVLLPCSTVREDKVISPNHRFYPGQIIYSKIRPNLAKVVIVDFEGLCSADMYPVDALIDANYLQRYMLSESFLVQAVKTDTRVAMPKINQTELNALAVPVPPLAEQRRIVAKVDELMALVGALETQLATARAAAEKLLSTAVAELVTSRERRLPQRAANESGPLSSVIPLKPLNRHFARAVLSAEIVHRLHAEPTFGRIKHQKIFHLCEHIARLAEIDGQYHREAAGPLDNNLIYAAEAEIKQQQWYEKRPRERFGHAYFPLAKAGGHENYLASFGTEKVKLVVQIIEQMRSWDTDQCEIISTAYAAWNDLLIWKQEVTDEAILHEVLERWHPKKKRFEADRWRSALRWIREHGFTPSGFGKPTMNPN